MVNSYSESSRYRRHQVIATSFALVIACDARCVGQTPPPTTATKPTEPPDEPMPAAKKPLREVHIERAAVDEIPVLPVKAVPTPDYTLVKAARPKTLMVEPFLRLSWQPWPLSPNRGFVVVHEGPDDYSPVVEARLVDFDTGDVLARVDKLSQGEFAKVGVAFGETKVGGLAHVVLVHAEDGLTVPLWPVTEEESRRVFINAGTGDAWVFRAETEYDWDEAPEDSTIPPYRFAFWGDLRVPPPEPSLPFWHHLDRSAWEPPAGWLGPSNYIQAEVPLFVAVGDDECPKVELLPDGYRCSREWALSDGWRGGYNDALGITVMTNEEKGVVQYLEVGESCGIAEATLEPPRAVLECSDFDGWLLWSPDAVVKIPQDWFRATKVWARKHGVLFLERHDSGGALASHRWIDVVSQTAANPTLLRTLDPYSITTYAVYRETDHHLGFLNVGAWETFPILPERRCQEDQQARQTEHGFAVVCSWGSSGTTAVFSFSQQQYAELPRLEDFWVSASGELVGVKSDKGQRLLQRWPGL